MKKTILITGANSILGQTIIQKLHTEYELLCLIRSSSNELLSFPSVEYLHHDLFRPLSKIKLSPNIYAVIHIAGVTDQHVLKNKGTLADNITFAQNIATFVKKSKTKHIIFISSNSVNYSTRDYARSKKQAEEILSQLSVPLTIIRPTAIYDPPKIKKLQTLINQLPFVPLINHGNFLFQPTTSENISRLIAYSLKHPPQKQIIYTVGNSIPISLKQFVNSLSPNKPIFSIPTFLAKLLISPLKIIKPQLHTYLTDILLTSLIVPKKEIGKLPIKTTNSFP